MSTHVSPGTHASTSMAFNPIVVPLDGINLIEASAGTGKTWNICGLYLRLLLERKLQVQQILVVTFTIAATAELRERIRGRITDALGHMRHVLDGTRGTSTADAFIVALIDRLIDTLGFNPDDLASRLALALQTFDEASIFTIHGFCQRALSDTAFASGRPFDFELASDDNEIILEAVNDFWRRRVAAEGFSPALATFMIEKKDTPQTLARLVARHVAKPLAQTVWPPELDQPDNLVADVAKLDAAYETARAAWVIDRNAVTDCVTKGLPGLNKQTYKPKSIAAAAVAWDTYFMSADPITELEKTHQLLCASMLKDKTNNNQTTPKHTLCDQLDEVFKAQTAVRDALLLARLKLIRTLIEEVTKDLPRRKRERRVIAFNDMLLNLNDALHHKRYPWLAESLRQRFPAALIDEFQDTDPLQFSIFDSIYGDGKSALFLVGDPKQAIYSFRNADLYTYLEARKRAAALHTLDANQRSTPGLITAVNGLFERNRSAFMLAGLAYQSFKPGQRTRPALMDLSEPASATDSADLRVWMLPTPPVHRSDARKLAVQATAAEVARLLTEAKAGRIFIGDEALKASDIAILVRTHAQGSELKRALARLKVGSVELLQESVFASVDADEVERLLMAINEPSRVGLLRAALATEMIGCDASEIAALSADELRLQQRIEQFTAFRDTWIRLSAGVMFRQLLADEGVSARMLCRADGERRLTNLLHLGEELHKAAQVHDTPEALLRWFAEQRREGAVADATQLRLESDENLVQIATIHKAKGLEYGIVFCPFLWDGFYMERRTGLDGREYHGFGGSPGTAVIDFSPDAKDDPAIKAQVKLEDSAELLRLAYVAMTRAVYRCYLIAGTYAHTRGKTPSTSQSCDSLLNWLVAGDGHTPETWWDGGRSCDEIASAWGALAQACHPHVALIPLPVSEGSAVVVDQPSADALVALTPPARIANPWRISSFSGLANGAINEATNAAAATDHDARATPRAPVGLPPPDIAADDILRFPRGTNAGDCLHALFERIDFTDASAWKPAIDSALRAHPQADARWSGASATATPALAAMMERMLVDVLSTEIIPGFTLQSLSPSRRLIELEFSLSAGDMPARWLNGLLMKSGYDVPRLAYGSLEGYLKGFIDLVFEHDGRFWILDWKSNHLGYAAGNYDRSAVDAAMAEHGYHLQHLIYSVALDRHLSHRMNGYRYDEHFGGVVYLFVRGVRPSWVNADGTPAGVFSHRPDGSTIDALNDMLRGARRRSA